MMMLTVANAMPGPPKLAGIRGESIGGGAADNINPLMGLGDDNHHFLFLF